MRRIAVATIAAISVLALLTTAAGASAPRGRHAAPAKCLPVHSRVIAADTEAQVYARREGGEPTEFFACAYGSKHTYNLGSGPPNLSAEGGSRNTSFTLGGVFLAYESYWFTSFPTPGAIECEQDVEVENLRTGRILHKVPTGTSSAPSLCFGPVITLIVKSDGAVAWVAGDEEEHHPEPAPLEVHAVDRTGSRLLSSGPEIEPESLALGGSTLYWMQDGKPMSAVLN